MKECQVKGCTNPRRSPKLCRDHMLAWHTSPEIKEGDRVYNTTDAFARWLRRLHGEARPVGTPS